MAYTVLDPEEFTDNGLFSEDGFLAAAENRDWSQFDSAHVLIRGCGGAPIPPWAFMHLTARLVGIAKSIRYGNEHDNIVVYRQSRSPQKKLASGEPTE